MSASVIGKGVAANDEINKKFESKDNTHDPLEQTASYGDGSNISLENMSDAAGDSDYGLVLETRK